MILELDTEGLRDDILVAEIQKVRALQQHVRQHEDHERIAALRHRLLHDGQELVFALHHAFGINTGDLADTEVVVSNMEILEIREQQRIGGLIVGTFAGIIAVIVAKKLPQKWYELDFYKSRSSQPPDSLSA